jgi:hypothetical protein
VVVSIPLMRRVGESERLSGTAPLQPQGGKG